MKILSVLFVFCSCSLAWAGIPATPVMTLYRFNGPSDMPYYSVESIGKNGPGHPVGTLAQGTSVIPCVVVKNGLPLTSGDGVPYVGFEVVVDARKASSADTAKYRQTVEARRSMQVENNQCGPGTRFVLDVRSLYSMAKPPLFDPPQQAAEGGQARLAQGMLDQIVRSFHNSAACSGVNRQLMGRRGRLERAWDSFIQKQQGRWSLATLQRAKHLDYTMRTALFEGHLERGCNAYGACERNIIALSIRNRGLESCASRLGCSGSGDFQGVSSKVSQYNIWDEYLTQISGLTSCYLRDDLATTGGVTGTSYRKLQAMYAQSLGDVQRILFGNDRDLSAVFPGNTLDELKSLRHYYHAPAMGKCFPQHDRVEYMSGAVARRGHDFALIANARIQVGEKRGDGYLFKSFVVHENERGDQIRVVDDYPGFIVDARRVSLSGESARCRPYGIPGGCRFSETGRYRKTPTWVNSGKPLEIKCRIADQGGQCQGPVKVQQVRVGGVCDTQMRPFGGIE
ncbi:MAG: hypothetical protein PHI97_01560 [Desulfobulbus sp.]|nr:hypothetical protein [Desulfobulbus sp.]